MFLHHSFKVNLLCYFTQIMRWKQNSLATVL